MEAFIGIRCMTTPSKLRLLMLSRVWTQEWRGGKQREGDCEERMLTYARDRSRRMQQVQRVDKRAQAHPHVLQALLQQCVGQRS
jgi:hypothetical protein